MDAVHIPPMPDWFASLIRPRKARWFWPIFATIVLSDCTTKELVVAELSDEPGSHQVLGEWVRFTLVYNRGASMNLSLGEASRIGFSLFAIVVLVVLFQHYRRAPQEARLKAAALALVAGGALGNLLDRLRSPRGVVDFIDVGIGDIRSYIFNVADIGVAIGAVLLAIALWREDRDQGRMETAS